MKRNMTFSDIKVALRAFNSQLNVIDKKIGLVVCGGAALNALGLVERTTSDIDVVGFADEVKEQIVVRRAKFPGWLREAAGKVARDLGLPKDWLNDGPASLVELGLPEGFADRLNRIEVGTSLAVYYISRIDQIHFKLYASADRGGYHIDDLIKLKPTEKEILVAAKWTMTHDVSPTFRDIMIDLVRRLGFHDASKRLQESGNR
jgi:hypothetical protein